MNRRRPLTLALIALVVAACICQFPTPTPGPGGGVTYTVPPPILTVTNPPQIVNPTISPEPGSINGTAGGSLPVQCTGANGNIIFPPGSFVGNVKFTVQCMTEPELRDLDTLVKNSTNQTGEVLGAIRVEPSPYPFFKPVELNIPLVRQRPDLANRIVDLWVAAPNRAGGIEKISQASVAVDGWSARATVDHFSTFVLVDYPPPTIVPTITPHVSCTDPLGCVVAKPGETVKIAALLQVDKDGVTYIPTAILDGIVSAMQARGSLYGHGIELVQSPTACNQQAGVAAKLALSDPRVVGIVASTCTDDILAAMDYVTPQGSVLLSATNGDYSLTLPSAYRAGFYRVAPSDTMEATAVAYYAITKQSRTSVKIIHDQDTFRTELANTYSRSFGAMGGRVLGFYPVNSSIFNLDSLLTALYATEIPSLYYVALPNKTATSVFGALYSKTYYAPLAGASSLLDSGFASSVNSAAAEGMILARLRPAGKDASPYGYDTMNLLFAAIDKAAVLDSDGTLYIGKSTLRNALASLSLNGQTGLLLCNKYGDCAHPIFDIYMFKGTDFTAIDQVTIPSSFGIGAVLRGE